MEKTLVLVRHGKPERGTAGMPDVDRALTEEGRAALVAPDGFPRIFARLEDAGHECVELWVSPALRARQTADAVEDAISRVQRTEHESLWEQDIDGFLQEVAESDAGCIVAVGHVPFMNETLELLCGECPGFTPGSVAAVALPDGFDPAAPDHAGRLLWFEPGPRA